MKRIVIFLCCLGLIVPVFADTNICRKTNTAIILLSRSTDGTSMSSNATDHTWSVTFNYTTLSAGSNTLNTMSGLSACNSISGTANTANTALVTTISDVGVNCWCEMWIPAHSYWTFSQTYASESACASGCPSACATAVKTSSLFRTGMFGAIW